MQIRNYNAHLDEKVEKFLMFILAVSPLFALTVQRWMNSTLILSGVLAFYLLLRLKSENLSKVNYFLLEKKWFLLVIFALSTPLLASFLSQLLKNEWIITEFDSPLRFFLAIPIFLIIISRNIQITRYWSITFPLALILTLLLLPFSAQTGWADNPLRQSTSFVDPLTFGRISLTFSLVTLFMLQPKKNKWFFTLLQILGILAGFYLSIRSGSRTGWFAVLPVSLLFFSVLMLRLKIFTFLGAALMTVIIASSLYYTFETVKNRTDQAFTEIITYKPNAMNEDTSVGLRISFWRMGIYYFKIAPLKGLTNQELLEHSNDSEISQYAGEAARKFPINHLFHNEFITNMVRHGIWGLISTSLLFFVPLSLCIFAAFKRKYQWLPLFGIAYVTSELISGMSTEVFSLKFLAALYAMVIAVLCGSLLNMLYPKNIDS